MDTRDFKLSSTLIEDLFIALENFDFGVFIFKPDDIGIVRNNQVSVVRDNIIFELGLFLGKLGRDRVFFVQPNDVKNFHFPTDLLGVVAGIYNSRGDGNWHAALGPFCNQVRERLSLFVYESFIDLTNESKEAKKIATEKKDFWEMLLSASLLRSRMNDIKRSFDEIQKGHVFRRTTNLSIKEFGKWYQLALCDFMRIVDIAKDIYLIELQASWGEPGIAGDIFEIKKVVDKIAGISRDLLSWEIDLQAIQAPDELSNISKLMRGWSLTIIDEFYRLPQLLEVAFTEENSALGKPIEINLEFDVPPNIDEISEIMDRIRRKVLNGQIEYE